jgi:serine/threonine-protein kinase
MRWVEGGEDLGDRIDAVGGPRDLATTLDVLDQIGGALDAAHALGLVHRDVKPSNILLEGDRAFLTDFGVMRRVEGGNGLTRSEEFMGTIEWAAPELIDGGALGPATDVYSLGCVFYACLAARTPNEGESPGEVLMAHLQKPPPKLPDKQLQPVLDRAMAKDPAARFQTAGELAAAARAAAAGNAVPAAPAPAPPRRRRLALARGGRGCARRHRGGRRAARVRRRERERHQRPGLRGPGPRHRHDADPGGARGRRA